MTSRYFLIVALIGVSPSFSQGGCGEYTTTPPTTYALCNQTVISAIKAQWRITGVPQNIGDTVASAGAYIMRYTSYAYKNDGTKCLIANVNERFFDIVFTQKSGSPPMHQNYNIKPGSEGTVIGGYDLNIPQAIWVGYVLYVDEKVMINYACSETPGSPLPMQADIYLTDAGFKNKRAKRIAKKYYIFFKNLGFDMKYIYGKECFTNCVVLL